MILGLPQDLTWYKLLMDQGGPIAGIAAVVAGLIAYAAGRVQAKATRQAAKMQMEIEQRKVDQEVETLRKSLATEIRQLVVRALTAHDLLKNLSNSGHPITTWMVESKARVPRPVVYPNSAHKIGLLGSDTMDVVIIYNLFDIANAAAAQLQRYRTPDDITPIVVMGVAQAFLAGCTYAKGVLPKLSTGVARHDDHDRKLFGEIDRAASSVTN